MEGNVSALWLYRFGHACVTRGIPLLPMLSRNLNYLIFNSYVPPTANIGEGTVLGYGGMALVIHARAHIGRRCVIGQCVTIGAAAGYASAETHPVPTIGDDCYIGAGAKILGGITIGDRCTIGANAVVLADLPAGSIAVGAPARVVGTNAPDYRAIRP
jgi:serine O-acetyltransferase